MKFGEFSVQTKRFVSLDKSFLLNTNSVEAENDSQEKFFIRKTFSRTFKLANFNNRPC